MKFNLAVQNEADRAFAYLARLTGGKKLCELKAISPRRTLPQNNYLHLLLSAFGAHFGYTLDEAKLIYKDLNKNIYEYAKKKRTFYRSSADLTKEEMAKSIDVLRDWSEKGGYPLPLATDQEWLRQIENAIEEAKYYL